MCKKRFPSLSGRGTSFIPSAIQARDDPGSASICCVTTRSDVETTHGLLSAVVTVLLHLILIATFDQVEHRVAATVGPGVAPLRAGAGCPFVGKRSVPFVTPSLRSGQALSAEVLSFVNSLHLKNLE